VGKTPDTWSWPHACVWTGV